MLPGEDPDYSPPADNAEAVAVSHSTIPWLAAVLAVSLGLSVVLIRRLNSITRPVSVGASSVPAEAAATAVGTAGGAAVGASRVSTATAKNAAASKATTAASRRNAKHLAQ